MRSAREPLNCAPTPRESRNKSTSSASRVQFARSRRSWPSWRLLPRKLTVPNSEQATSRIRKLCCIQQHHRVNRVGDEPVAFADAILKLLTRWGHDVYAAGQPTRVCFGANARHGGLEDRMIELSGMAQRG